MNQIFSHCGKISHDKALEKARVEYLKYQNQLIVDAVSPVERHFLKAVKEIELLSFD